MTEILGERRAARVDVRSSMTLRAPCCLGWLRPTILLPASFETWDRDKQGAVLAHELHHIKRGDYLSQGLALLNRSLYWFHPLAWWLPRHLSRLAERSCDAAAAMAKQVDLLRPHAMEHPWERLSPTLQGDLSSWLRDSLGPSDYVAVVGLHNQRLHLYQDLTTARKRVTAAMRRLQFGGGDVLDGEADPGVTGLADLLREGHRLGLEPIHNALVDVAEAVTQLPGRSSMVVVSSAFDGTCTFAAGGDSRLLPWRCDDRMQRVAYEFKSNKELIQIIDPGRACEHGFDALPPFSSRPIDNLQASMTSLGLRQE